MYVRLPVACSTLLHLLAAYPKTGIAIGLVSLVGIVGNSPLGPTNYAGLESTLARMEESSDVNISQAQLDELDSMAKISDANIQHVLDSCECHDYEIDHIRNSPELLDSVRRIYVIDLLSRYDPVAVRNMLATGKAP